MLITVRTDVRLNCYLPNFCAVDYDAALYGPNSAARLGIALPPSLAGAVVRRKASFLAGRYCAKLALLQAGESVSRELPIGDDRSPAWPAGLTGSITHTDGFAAAAVAPTSEVHGIGIDAERIMSTKTCHSISGEVMCDGERELQNKDTGWSDSLFSTLVFSAKESIFKCLYSRVKRYFDFLDVAIVDIDPIHCKFRFRVLNDLCAQVSAGFEAEGHYSFLPDSVLTYIALPRNSGAREVVRC